MDSTACYKYLKSKQAIIADSESRVNELDVAQMTPQAYDAALQEIGKDRDNKVRAINRQIAGFGRVSQPPLDPCTRFQMFGSLPREEP